MEGSGQRGRGTRGGHLSIPGIHTGPNQTTVKPGILGVPRHPRVTLLADASWNSTAALAHRGPPH